MTNKVLKSVLSIAAVLAASSFAMQAQAHCLTQGITQTGTTNALQQDVYMLLCPASTVSINGRVSLVSGNATGVTYQIAKGGYTAASQVDTTATAASACTTIVKNGFNYDTITSGAPATYVSVTGGAGAYSLAVSKNSTTATNYAMEFHCLDAVGVEVQPGAGGVWEQGGPAANTPNGLTDQLDADMGGVSGSGVAANDKNTDANIVINH